jgi:hypothetical protein
MHNERIFPSLQRRALDIHDHSTKRERVTLRPSHGRSRFLDQKSDFLPAISTVHKTPFEAFPHGVFIFPFNRQRICTYQQLC